MKSELVWILTRDPAWDDDSTFDSVITTITDTGYEFKNLQKTLQGGGCVYS